jgi:hypothetical protein
MANLDIDRDLKWRRMATVGFAACLVTVAVTAVYPLLQARLGATVVGYRVGETIDLPAEVYRNQPRTVVVFARSSCAASQRMKPLFARIVEQVSGDSSASVTLVTPQANASGEAGFADELGIPVRQHITRELTALRVARVPTVVVVNQRGQVEYVQSGQPQTAASEAALLAAVAPARQER